MKVVKSLLVALSAVMIGFGTLVATPAAADTPEINLNKGTFGGNKYKQAVDGYDVVAYFTDGAPVKGSADYSTQYKGVDWYFASQDHLDTFKADPAKYAPQYGGYCAWALGAKKQFANGNPKYWHIENDKLYLNYSKGVQKKWFKEMETFIANADGYWPAILSE